MSLQKRVLSTIEQVIIELQNLSTKFSQIGSFSQDKKNELYEKNSVCLEAMKHAKQMILKDVEDTDFMLPFTVGLMIYGDLCGQTKYGETLSKLKSEYGKQRLKNDKKQLALIEIEGELNNSTYPFDKRGHRAKFCKEMLAKYTEIQDIKTIERLFDRLKKAKNTHLAS